MLRATIRPLVQQDGVRTDKFFTELFASRNPRVKRRLIVIALAGQERPRKAGFSGCGDSRNYVS